MKKHSQIYKNSRIYIHNELVYYKSHFKSIVKWIKAIYLKQVSVLTHLVRINGVVKMVHSNQIRKSSLIDKYPPHIVQFPKYNYNEVTKRNYIQNFKRERKSLSDSEISPRSKVNRNKCNIPEKLRVHEHFELSEKLINKNLNIRKRLVSDSGIGEVRKSKRIQDMYKVKPPNYRY